MGVVQFPRNRLVRSPRRDEEAPLEALTRADHEAEAENVAYLPGAVGPVPMVREFVEAIRLGLGDDWITERFRGAWTLSFTITPSGSGHIHPEKATIAAILATAVQPIAAAPINRVTGRHIVTACSAAHAMYGPGARKIACALTQEMTQAAVAQGWLRRDPWASEALRKVLL